MKRTLTTVLATIAMFAAFAAPAAAASGDGPGATPPYHGPRALPLTLPLCVTTTWRSRHTHTPKTRPGTLCVGTPDMWIPRAYIEIGYINRTHLVYIAR
jgi:hypothetical protein